MNYPAVDVKEPFYRFDNYDIQKKVSSDIKSMQSVNFGCNYINRLSNIYNSPLPFISCVMKYFSTNNMRGNTASTTSENARGLTARHFDEKHKGNSSCVGPQLLRIRNWMHVAMAGLYGMGMIQSLNAAALPMQNRQELNSDANLLPYTLKPWNELSFIRASSPDIDYIMEKQGNDETVFFHKKDEPDPANPYLAYKKADQHSVYSNESHSHNTVRQRNEALHHNAGSSGLSQTKAFSDRSYNQEVANGQPMKTPKFSSPPKKKHVRNYAVFPQPKNVKKLKKQLQTRIASHEYPISEENLNSASYGSCKVFRIYTEENQGITIPTEKQVVKMGKQWFRVKLNTFPEHGVKYEIPDIRSNRYYPIACHNDKWHFEKPTSSHASDSLVNALEPEFFTKNINAYDVSAPAKDGLQWRNDKSYLRIDGKLVMLTKSQFKNDRFYIKHAKTKTLILSLYRQKKFHFHAKIENSSIKQEEQSLKWNEIRSNKIAKQLEKTKEFIAKYNIINSFKHLNHALNLQKKYDLGKIEDICQMSSLALKTFMNFPDQATMDRANVDELRQVWQSLLQPLQQNNKLTYKRISALLHFFSSLSAILTEHGANDDRTMLYKNHYLSLIAVRNLFYRTNTPSIDINVFDILISENISMTNYA
jgi:hypothetical protein